MSSFLSSAFIFSSLMEPKETRGSEIDCKMVVNAGERNWLIPIGQGLWFVRVLIRLFWYLTICLWISRCKSLWLYGKMHLKWWSREFIPLQCFSFDQSSQMRQECPGWTSSWAVKAGKLNWWILLGQGLGFVWELWKEYYSMKWWERKNCHCNFQKFAYCSRSVFSNVSVART